MAAITKNMRLEIHLVGLAPIMFDRYCGSNDATLRPEEKLYKSPEDGATLIMPAENIMSFLSAELTNSATKLVFESKIYKRISLAMKACVQVEGAYATFSRNGKPIVFGKFNDKEVDTKSGVYVFRNVAKIKKGNLVVPHPKTRPVIPLPWELKFSLIVCPHPAINEDILFQVWDRGGIMCGLGTFRPVYGKFAVKSFKFVPYKAR